MTVEVDDDLNPSYNSNFTIIFNEIGGSQLSYMARSVILPGFDVAAIDVPYRTHNLAMPGNSRARETLSVEFILSERYKNYKYVRRWARKALKGEGDILECLKDVTVVILDSNKNPIDQIVYRGCYPNNITSLNLESGIVDTMPLTFTVTFMFEEEVWDD